MKRRRSALLAGSLLAASALLGTAFVASDASADDKPDAQAELLVIHATHCPNKHIDARIGAAPGIGWECLDLLDRKVLQLHNNKVTTAVLPNGRLFHVHYHGRDKERHKLTASFNQPDGGAALMKLADITIEPNKPFNVGGLSHERGVLLLTVRLLPSQP